MIAVVTMITKICIRMVIMVISMTIIMLSSAFWFSYHHSSCCVIFLHHHRVLWSQSSSYRRYHDTLLCVMSYCLQISSYDKQHTINSPAHHTIIIILFPYRRRRPVSSLSSNHTILWDGGTQLSTQFLRSCVFVWVGGSWWGIVGGWGY